MAGFARYYMIESLNGKTESEIPQWFESWQETGLVMWFDDGDGVVRYSNEADNEIFNFKGSPAEIREIIASHAIWKATRGQKGSTVDC